MGYARHVEVFVMIKLRIKMKMMLIVVEYANNVVSPLSYHQSSDSFQCPYVVPIK